MTGARELVELGAGTADKTRVLLEGGAIERYVPFDVDGGMVRDTAAALAEEYPGLEIEGITGDFEHDLAEIPPPQPGNPRASSTASSTPTSTPASSSTSPSTTSARAGRDAAARPPRPLGAGGGDRRRPRVRCGEELRTAISARFTRERVESDLGAAGLELVEWMTDPEGLFALSLSRTAPGAAPRA
jgi:uncharacterized SAM-dependent methyltransferase